MFSHTQSGDEKRVMKNDAPISACKAKRLKEGPRPCPLGCRMTRPSLHYRYLNRTLTFASTSDCFPSREDYVQKAKSRIPELGPLISFPSLFGVSFIKSQTIIRCRLSFVFLPVPKRPGISGISREVFISGSPIYLLFPKKGRRRSL